MGNRLRKAALKRRSSRTLHSLAFVSLFFATGIARAATQSGNTPLNRLPTLTTARQAHDLPLDAAAHAYPVHLKAVVTYYDPYIDSRHTALFVHDSTGSIFITLARPSPVPLIPGTLIEVTGVSAAGDFASIVGNASARVIGRSHVPAEAKAVGLSQMLTGAYDGQWVEVEGVVRSVEESGKNINLEVATSEGSIIATSLKQADADYVSLIDAKIRLHANEAPQFNHHRQMTGVRLLFPDIAQVKIEEPAGVDPFASPTLRLDRLLRFTPNLAFRHRVHVRGRVSLYWPGRSICIQDADHGLCVESIQTADVQEGDTVDLIGFPVINGLSPTLTDARFRTVSHGPPSAASPISAEAALRGDSDGKLVQISGTLIGTDRAAKDPTIVLESGGFLFPVVLPRNSRAAATPVWEEGSVLRVLGICSVNLDPNKKIWEGSSIPASFRILSRSPGDLVVTQSPSWWTAAHLLPVLAVLAVALCVLAWALGLRNRLAQQTAVIRQQNAILHDLSFQDGLTKVANRRKFDEILENEFGAAVRTMIPVSLLMIDIDYFKALNDQYGHQRGDDCLVQVARALESTAIRKQDLVARYGGEEFAVILPDCDTSGALAVAERMRAAVLDLAIENGRSPVNGCLSISVGVATLVPGPDTAARTLVGLADQALYQSKLSGRNRTTLFDLGLAALQIATSTGSI